MPLFVLAYRNPAGYTRTAETAAAWRAWFARMVGQPADLGKPVDGGRAALGDCDPGRTELGGYSLIDVPDLDAAVRSPRAVRTWTATAVSRSASSARSRAPAAAARRPADGPQRSRNPERGDNVMAEGHGVAVLAAGAPRTSSGPVLTLARAGGSCHGPGRSAAAAARP
jgi:hypothetical protein